MIVKSLMSVIRILVVHMVCYLVRSKGNFVITRTKLSIVQTVAVAEFYNTFKWVAAAKVFN